MKKIFVGFAAVLALVPTISAFALSEEQEKVISGECDTIHETLKSLQKVDSKVRVYLGSYYEKILNKYMIPLNSRLVENSISNTDLINNQASFKGTKELFSNDFISYQKNLEELINSDCKTNPSGFYEKLESVRSDRKKVRQDVLALESLITKHKKAVNSLMEKL